MLEYDWPIGDNWPMYLVRSAVRAPWTFDPELRGGQSTYTTPGRSDQFSYPGSLSLTCAESDKRYCTSNKRNDDAVTIDEDHYSIVCPSLVNRIDPCGRLGRLGTLCFQELVVHFFSVSTGFFLRCSGYFLDPIPKVVRLCRCVVILSMICCPGIGP